MTSPQSPESAPAHKRRRQAVHDAWLALLGALTDPTGGASCERPIDWRQAGAARATTLWLDQLLIGEDCDLQAPLADAPSAPAHAGPVLLSGLDVTLVCPHHFTVAFGSASVAYLPQRRWASFGAISEVLTAACARLVLQEQATEDAVRAVRAGLAAQAAWVQIQAAHPCHRVGSPRAHRATVRTVATAGAPRAVRRLLRMVGQRRQRPAAARRRLLHGHDGPPADVP